MTSQPIKSTMVKQIPKNVKHQLVAVTMSRHRDILCQYATNRKLPGHPPAYRRVASGSCLFVVLLSVLSLSRLSPWRGFLPRLTWTHQTPSPSPTYTPSRRSSLFRLHHLSLHCAGLNFAHASLNMVLHILLSFRWLFPFFACVCHRYAPLLISNTWPTGLCAEHLQKVYTHTLV
jgi:hypothetical protein